MTTRSPIPWAFMMTGLSDVFWSGHLVSVNSTSKSTLSLIRKPSHELVSTRVSLYF